MLIKEWHTQLRQELNKINSALYDVLLEQEIDMAFNKMIEVYFNDRYSPKSNKKKEGFEESQKRIDDLRSLTTVYKNTAILGSNFQNSFDYDKRTLFILPQDYRYKIATRIKTTMPVCNTIFTPNQTSINYYIYGFDLTSISNYNTFSIRTKSPNITILPANSNLSNYTSEDFNLVKNIIIDSLNTYEGPAGSYKTTKPVYFENFYTYTNNGYLFIVYQSIPDNSKLLQYYNGTTWVDFTNLITITDVKYVIGQNNQVISDRMSSHDDIYAMQADPFNKTVDYSPSAFFEDKYYYTLYDKNNFVVNEVEMTYLRTPRTVSYYANISSDMPESTHQEIISLTAQYFLEEFESPRWNTHKETVSNTE